MIPFIAFKDKQTESEFDQIKSRLQAFIIGAGAYMYFTYGVTLVVIDLLRDDQKSVYGHGRGVDFRTHNLTEKQGDALVDFLKWQFPYYLNPPHLKYSVCDERKVGTSEGRAGAHIHGRVKE